jgi:hypothetical protein
MTEMVLGEGAREASGPRLNLDTQGELLRLKASGESTLAIDLV